MIFCFKNIKIKSSNTKISSIIEEEEEEEKEALNISSF